MIDSTKAKKTKTKKVRHEIKHRPQTTVQRQEILRVAAKKFGEKGTANTALADIADEIGMTPAGVLHYFGSKRDLLIEVLKYRDEQGVIGLKNKQLPIGFDTFRHLINTAFDNAKHPGIVQTYLTLSSESTTESNPGRDYFTDRYSVLRSQLDQAFKEVMSERGVLTLTQDQTTMIHDASASVLAVMDGLQLQWLLDKKAVDLGKITEFALKAIVSAVVNPQEDLLG
jgi:AcrR family transcriptional regulator